jgi:hypothetical protein
MTFPDASTTVSVMVRRLTTFLVLMLAVVLAGSMALANASVPSIGSSDHAVASAAAPTFLQHVRPVGGKGHLLASYRSIASRSGASCSAGSEAIGSAAYRCMAHNKVYDPCWVSSNETYVYCLSAAWSFDVVQLKVTKGYDNTGLSSHVAKIPWGVQLANGVQCGLVQGATSNAGGKPVRFLCSHVKYGLAGKIDKSHKAWRIRKADHTSGGYKLGGWLTLTKAWFGKPSRKGP